ncbi:hypothetical protein [Paenibacillus polymyxa]|uniref:Type II secretion system protein GspF domain-containing protein n=1 Tax=Paenibacillus polymyxa (strain SC2) TaxID=886882 RepID=E3EKD3_PAEPS|nr:hypothetical protein [Paenibacillus polymyxa]ADO59460.1 hypothetical protein PPSC2_27765 [Paenibacillus polymyxa SC2]WPQ59701.1 hypothetical protein SKN87_29005 [Paenibacillus polymyxa]
MIYLIFFMVWAGVILSLLLQTKSKKRLPTSDIAFESPFYHVVYRMSFGIPFKWFVEDDRNLTNKGRKTEQLLIQSGYHKKFTVQSFMAFKVLVFFTSILLIFITLGLIDKLPSLFHWLLQVDTTRISKEGVSLDMILITSILYLSFSLFPGIILRQKAKKELVNSNKDLPILHMFTILMLRSNKTVTEILFALTKLNSYHKKVFERGYLMYLRNKHEGMEYLRSQFDNARFIEMFNLLEDIGTYAREECISIMDSNMKSLVHETNTLKRRNDITRLVYSEASMVVPFSAIILLGAAPIVIAGLRMFSLSTVM